MEEESDAVPPRAAAAAPGILGSGAHKGADGYGRGAQPQGQGHGQQGPGRRDELPLIVQGLLSLRSPSVGPGGVALGGADDSRPPSRPGSSASSVVAVGWDAGEAGSVPLKRAQQLSVSSTGGMLIVKGDSGGSTTSGASSDMEARVKPLSPSEEGSQAPITVRGG